MNDLPKEKEVLVAKHYTVQYECSNPSELEVKVKQEIAEKRNAKRLQGIVAESLADNPSSPYDLGIFEMIYFEPKVLESKGFLSSKKLVEVKLGLIGHQEDIQNIETMFDRSKVVVTATSSLTRAMYNAVVASEDGASIVNAMQKYNQEFDRFVESEVEVVRKCFNHSAGTQSLAINASGPVEQVMTIKHIVEANIFNLNDADKGKIVTY